MPGKKKPTPPRELSTLLSTYSFPGNIRELEGMIFDAVSRHESGVLSMESFKEKMGHRQPSHQKVPPEEAAVQASLAVAEDKRFSLPDQLPTLKEAEQMLIEEALKRAGGNQTIAAQLLGLSRRALNNRLSRARK